MCKRLTNFIKAEIESDKPMMDSKEVQQRSSKIEKKDFNIKIYFKSKDYSKIHCGRDKYGCLWAGNECHSRWYVRFSASVTQTVYTILLEIVVHNIQIGISIPV